MEMYYVLYVNQNGDLMTTGYTEVYDDARAFMRLLTRSGIDTLGIKKEERDETDI